MNTITRLLADDGFGSSINIPIPAVIDLDALVEKVAAELDPTAYSADTRGPAEITLTAFDDDGDVVDQAWAEITVGPEIPMCEPPIAPDSDEECGYCGRAGTEDPGTPVTHRIIEGTEMEPVCRQCADEIDTAHDVEIDEETGCIWRALDSSGNSGGMIHRSICIRSGLRWERNTWDQDWSGTGEPVETERYYQP